MPPHPKPLSHVSIGVRSYAASKAFYTAILEQLGLGLVFDSGPDIPRPVLGYGMNPEEELLNIFVVGGDAQPPGPGVHIAFNAPTRLAVRGFHEAALEAGGKCAGPPGPRERYGDDYYAAFVVCPDGWKIEAVCKANGEA